MKQRFCLDTSLLINAWRKHYCPHVFPSFWSRLEKLIVQRTVFSCEEVYLEIQEQDDDLCEWAHRRRGMFERPTEDHIFELSALMEAYPNFAAAGGSSNRADPWVIVHARLAKAVVVTDEHFAAKSRPTKPPKIPNVCAELNVPWMNAVEFLNAAGIQF